MLAVVIPAHNEALSIGACVQAVRRAAQAPALRGEPVAVIVVLDACTDATGVVARKSAALTVMVAARNVGVARARGAELALHFGARWLAFTDADTLVAPEWLAAQLALGCDAVCGTVAVGDWGSHAERTRLHHDATYHDADGHRHIHGANLGVSAAAYRRAGGFSPLHSSEDVALVRALQACNVTIAWSAAPRVVTSSRRDYRAPAGFGAALERAEQEAQTLACKAAD